MKQFYSFYLIVISIFASSYVYSQGDNCNTALTLTNVTNYCSANAAYTNAGSTASGFALAGCWGATATEDVWFSFTAIGTDVLVSVNGSGYGGTMVRPRISIYSGSCAGTITQLACANGTAGSGFTQVYRGGLVLGQTYLIRISSTSANEGTFGLCVNNYNPPASASADCSGAGKLCNKNPISVGTLNGGGTNANEPSSETGSCMTGDVFSDAETNSVWYTWTCGTSGTLLFDLTPLDRTNDLDYVLYQLSGTNPCGGRTIIRCNTSSCLNSTGSSGLNATDVDTSEDPGCDAGENAYCQQINMVAGTSYALLINNADGTSGFNITWGGTGTFLGPDPNIVASNTTVCAGSNVTFDGSTSTNYSSLNWTFNSTGSPVTASGVGPHTINFPTVGSYLAILQATSTVGCSSVEYANISVVNGPTISVSPAAICPGASTILTASGASTYTWSTGVNTASASVSPSVATVYTVSAGASGCVSSQTVQVSINTVPSGLSAGIDQTLSCSSPSVTLNGSITSPTNVTVNWTGANVCSTATTIASSACSQGIYTLTATDPSNGCSATATVQIFPNAGSPIVTEIPSTSTISCTNTLAAVSVSTSASPVTYSWSGPSIVGTNTTSIINVNQGGTYNYTVTDSGNGCIKSGTISVASNTTIPVFNPLSNGTITCVTNTISLDANIAGMNYSWVSPSLVSLSSSTNQVVTATSAATTALTFSVSVTNPVNGCSSNTVTIIVNPDYTIDTPTLSIAPATNSVITCLNSAVSLTASALPSANYSYAWSNGTLAAETSVTSANVYTVAVSNPTNLACSNSKTISITSNTNTPNLTVNNAVMACSDNTVTAVAQSTDAVNYSWTALTGTIISAPATSSNVIVGAVGVYSVTVTDIGTNCVNSATMSVTQTTIEAAFTADPTSGISPLTVNFTDQSSGAATYTYNFADGNTSTGVYPNAVNVVNTFTLPGVYTVTLTVEDVTELCASTSTLTIIVNENTSLVIPNVFTPNGDGVNDLFKIVTTGMKDLNCDIYNRWGTKVYTISTPSGSWDGGDHADGTYFFILKCNGYDGKEYKKEGYINMFK